MYNMYKMNLNIKNILTNMIELYIIQDMEQFHNIIFTSAHVELLHRKKEGTVKNIYITGGFI